MPKKSLDTISKSNPSSDFRKYFAQKKLKSKPVNPLPKDYYPKKSEAVKRRLVKKLPIVGKILGIIIVALIVFYPVYSFIFDIRTLFADGRYLILLQNNAEARGAGGFLGSFAVINFENGKPKNYYFESNIYKTDNQFNGQTPYPLPDFMQEKFKEGKSLTLHNSNYLADFASSSKIISDLYELEYGERVDGIIAINVSSIVDLLKLTGGIEVKPDNVTINSSNFYNTLQNKIDKEYFENQENLVVNQPKSVLANAVNPLFAKLKDVSYFKLYGFLKREIRQKQIQFWFKDDRSIVLAKYNFDGKIQNYSGESIMVVNNNIGGLKSSIAMEQSLRLEGSSKKARDRTLTVFRKHTGGKGFYSANVLNQNYTTVYLPLGSDIDSVLVDDVQLSLTDYTVKQENFKTTVSFWLSTYPDQTKSAKVYYTLPSVSADKIFYQKQSGIPGEQIDVFFNNKKYFSGYLKYDRKL